LCVTGFPDGAGGGDTVRSAHISAGSERLPVNRPIPVGSANRRDNFMKE
jgi:hypothetical protein